jgi:hypothetical protein
MTYRSKETQRGGPSFRRTLGAKAALAVAAILVLVLYLPVSLLAAMVTTSVYHTLGDGFSSEGSISTSVIVRNGSPFSFPGVELSYSYGARIVDGNATCQLPTSEGIKECGYYTVDLGVLRSGESKRGNLTLSPNHGNFTAQYYANVWVLGYLIKVNSINVSCHTKDGTHYTCAREGSTPEVLPPPIPGFPLESIIVGIIIGTTLILLRIKRGRRRVCLSYFLLGYTE